MKIDCGRNKRWLLPWPQPVALRLVHCAIACIVNGVLVCLGVPFWDSHNGGGVAMAQTAGSPSGEVTHVAPNREANPQWHQRDFWQTEKGSLPGDAWQFSDGEVRLVKPRDGGGNLLSPPLPAHFELSWKWLMEAGTNTGLKYRVRKFAGRWLGIEYQIIDEPIPLPAVHKGSTASIYELVAPRLDKPLRPAGEWNEARIVVHGDHLQHYLNGELVAAVTTSGPEWDAKMARSKFYGEHRFGQATSGDRVMLTDHGGKVTYKDFRFVPLEPPAPTATSATRVPQLGNAMRNSWADQQSVVVWTRTTANAEMVDSGPTFRSLAASRVAELSKSTDENLLLSSQLPENATLSQMFGAMPGAAGEVRLSYFPEHQQDSEISTPWSITAAEHDFTVQWKIAGLQPGTRYVAVVEARAVGCDSISAVARGSFQTAPPADVASALQFCVTTCHDFDRRDDDLHGHKIYRAMARRAPNFVVHAGDIEYYDHQQPWAWTIDLMRFKWGRLFSLPNNRNFYANTSSYFLKDDHDTLKNDCWAGQTYGAVSFEQGVRLFNDEQFPTHAPRYASIRWGRDLQIWILEGRDYRSPNSQADGPEKTILGAEQKTWLKRTLQESTAIFKLIVCPTPLVGPDRQNKLDNHANANFAWEGDELRQLLASIPGVIVCCGDRHWQYASVDQETGLWEFGCGPGSEVHQLGWKEGDERPEHRFLRIAGGFLSGELSYVSEGREGSGAARLFLRHHTVDGAEVSRFEFPDGFAADARQP